MSIDAQNRTQHPAARSVAPGKQGLYDPQFEHDACGVGFLVNVKGRKSHEIVRQALQILVNLNYRGMRAIAPIAKRFLRKSWLKRGRRFSGGVLFPRTIRRSATRPKRRSRSCARFLWGATRVLRTTWRSSESFM